MTIWEELDRRAAEAPAIGDLFEADLARAERFSARAGDFLFDYSKTAIDAGTRDLLLRLAAGTGVAERRAAMFAGEKINETEGRAVLHTALRALEGPIRMDGEDVLPDIRATRARMAAFAGDVRDGRFRAAGGAVTDVVNIGIGGSDLGPAMACTAFADIADGPRTHFLSNIDGAHAGEIMRACPPETTLVIVASKTFTTVETMTNAATLRDWMAAHVPDPAAQMVAVSSAADRAADWGIPADRVFGFGDYVGGRYSMWGPIGLPIMLAIGPQRFEAFLAGAAAMDAHFREAPFEANLPVLLALTGIWHRQVLGHPTRAVLPYDQRLARLPAYLQQLEMESNGKRVTMTGGAPARPTGPVVWGEPGTNGQHAFFQLIHQGTDVIPCEFLVVARGGDPALDHHHRLLIANCLAQSRALMVGRDMETARAMMRAAGFEGAELERQAAHRVFPGNRPSVTLICPALTPATLGGIVALYEHRVFVEGVILAINSFDQWGVELGKELAKSLEPVLDGGDGAGLDGSTRQLLAFARRGQEDGQMG